jgi:hypothetical protein
MEFFVFLAEFLLDLDYRKRPLNKLISQGRNRRSALRNCLEMFILH